MKRWDNIKALQSLIKIAEQKIVSYEAFVNNYIARRERQIDKWNERILQIERESMYKVNNIGFKQRKK